MFTRCFVLALAVCGIAAAQSHSPTAAEVWKQHMDLGKKHEATGHYSEAKAELEAALQAAGPKNGMAFASLVELEVAAAAMGQYTEAEELDNQAVRVGLEIYGKESPELAMPYANLAALYKDQGEYDRAEELGRRAQSLIARPADAPPSVRAYVSGTLSAILYQRGNLAEAEARLRQSIEIAETLPAPSDILAADLNNLAGLYAKTGRPAEAVATYQQAYRLCEQTGGATAPGLFFIQAGMASVEAGSGHYAEAVAAIESGIRVAEAGGAVNTMVLRDALAADASWLHKLKREVEARRARTRAKEVAQAAASKSYSQYTLDARQVAQSMAKRPQ
ncbi:MAG: tetratricopeptide repeat protein [Acidobacteriia bacterium]|nr:tetratricopeptide repeat protein [Terriglobia bacterium]